MAGTHRDVAAVGAASAVGVLGGLIGLGGAEFRLPLLLGVFQFRTLEAVILNKAISLVVVASALSFRTRTVPWQSVLESWPIILNLLVGSLMGAWLGAGVATGLTPRSLRRTIAVLLAVIAVILMFAHEPMSRSGPPLNGTPLVIAGVAAGLLIGTVASFLGVAGGELLIPTLVLLFALDIRLAGSVSLAISLPTMLSGFARYSRDKSFGVLAHNRRFVACMVVGSIFGTFIGGRLLGVIPTRILLPSLAAILVISAIKTWSHE